MKLIQDAHGDNNEWIFQFNEQDEKACDALNSLLDEELPLVIELDALEKLIRYHPLDIDLLHHAAVCLYKLDSIKNHKTLSYIYEQVAVSIALQAIPSEFNWEIGKINDQHLNNRPFFKAYTALAGKYKKMRKNAESKFICERVVSIAPRDGHGLRYLLVDFYQKEKDITALDKLIKKYPDENLLENAKQREQ